MFLYKPAITPLYDKIQSNTVQINNGGSYDYLQ